MCATVCERVPLHECYLLSMKLKEDTMCKKAYRMKISQKGLCRKISLLLLFRCWHGICATEGNRVREIACIHIAGLADRKRELENKRSMKRS